MKRAALVLAAACLSWSCASSAGRRAAELEREVHERDREITELRNERDQLTAERDRARAQLENLTQAAATGVQEQVTGSRPPPSTDEKRGAEVADEHRPTGSSTVPDFPGGEGEEQEEGEPDEVAMQRALERALVREGGLVLGAWMIQVEPEVSYFYSEPNDRRRDTIVTSVTVRLGMPWDTQFELHVPYVAYDHQRGTGTSYGLADIDLTLTWDFFREREYVPELLAGLRWKTASGDTDDELPKGTDADAVQVFLTGVKSHEPLVIFGSFSYTENFESDDDVEFGDTVGGKLGAILAATPDTSLLLDVDVNSHFAARVGGFEIGDSDRVSGVAEFGLASVLSRATLLDLTAGVGFTEAAPDFRFDVSLPITF